MDPDVSPTADDEAHLLQVDECFVYKIPPRQSSMGYRAEIWGLDKPFATCVIRAATVGDSLSLKLLNGAVLFAGVMITAEDLLTKGLDYFLEPVMDSSRYFVLRVENSTTGRVAHLGIGFRERQDAFDLRAALADHVKFLERQRKGLEPSDTFQTGTEDAPVSVALSDILKPLSIAAGDTLRLTVKSVSDRPRAEASVDVSIGPPVIKGLRPPPKAGPAVSMTSPVLAAAPPVSADDDDWGDFQSS